jgi:hypothetical protein
MCINSLPVGHGRLIESYALYLHDALQHYPQCLNFPGLLLHQIHSQFLNSGHFVVVEIAGVKVAMVKVVQVPERVQKILLHLMQLYALDQH